MPHSQIHEGSWVHPSTVICRSWGSVSLGQIAHRHALGIHSTRTNGLIFSKTSSARCNASSTFAQMFSGPTISSNSAW